MALDEIGFNIGQLLWNTLLGDAKKNTIFRCEAFLPLPFICLLIGSFALLSQS